MRINVQTKMLAVFSIVLVLMGMVGLMGISNLGVVSGLLTSMYEQQLMPISDLGRATEALHRMRVNVLEHMIADNEADMVQAEGKIADCEKEMLAWIDKYSKIGLTQEEKEWLAKFNAAWSAYKVDRDNILRLGRENNDQAAMALFSGAARQKMSTVQEALSKLVEISQRDAKVAEQQGKATYESSRMTMAGMLVLAILLGVGIGLFLSRAIARGVNAVARAAKDVAETDLPALVRNAQAIASGDLTQSLEIASRPVDVKSGDEIGEMGKSFNQMVQRLHEAGDAFIQMSSNLKTVVGQVISSSVDLNETSRQLSTASEQAGAATQQIAATIQDVARGNQEQSDSVQEASASVGRLSRSIDQIARGAHEQAKSIEKASYSVAQLNASISQVATLSREVQASAEQSQATATSGGKTVQKTLRGMAAIKESTEGVGAKIRELRGYSEQIGAIVETIDVIAEQTNLLALNAAIEAARAGEHGRGFAVVADEVRKLAERSSHSTKEIAALIAQVQKGTHEAVSAMERGSKEVEVGANLAEEAGEAMNNILLGAQKAADQVAQIVSAVQQMEIASQQVVAVMDSVSSVVEESTAATEAMAASSREMTGAIEKIAAVSEETSAAAEEVSASTEEMSAQVQEMVPQAQELARMARRLQAAAAQFKTGEHAQQGDEIEMKRSQEDWNRPQPQTQAPRLRPVPLGIACSQVATSLALD